MYVRLDYVSQLHIVAPCTLGVRAQPATVHHTAKTLLIYNYPTMKSVYSMFRHFELDSHCRLAMDQDAMGT